MKISNKRELHQIALKDSSDIGLKDFIKIDENLQNHIFLAKVQLYYLIILQGSEIFKTTYNQIMTIEDHIRDEKPILIERLRKCQLYYNAKLINMNILLVKKYYLLINKK